LTIHVDSPENGFDEEIILPIDVQFFWPRSWLQGRSAPTIVLYSWTYAGIFMDWALHNAYRFEKILLQSNSW
jgi:hypothetical protein